MRSLGSLVRNVAGVVAVVSYASWLATASSFPFTAAQSSTLRTAFFAALAVRIAAIAAALAAVSRRMSRALSAPEPDEAAVRRAARAAHRLPAYACGIVLACSGVTAAGIALAIRRAGVPRDLALAAAGVGLATTILAAMIAYSIAAAAGARVTEALRPHGDVAVEGTVRGKILVLGLGLATIAVLLFAATGYVRYRVDVDREYVSTAAHAQASALAAASGRMDPAIAEHVWIATSAPTALLGPGGRVVARFGPGEISFDGAASGPPGATRAGDGWLVTTRAAAGGTVATWLSERPLGERRAEFWRSLAAVGLLVYAATASLAWLAAGAITFPFRTLGRAADRIASGDLTVNPPSVSRDEIGQLAADFRRMTHGLKALVVDVQSASEGVSVGAREAGAIGERVRDGALDQQAGVVAVQAAVEAMEGSVSSVSRGVGGLSDYVAATTQAVGEMAAAFEDVRRKGVELERAMAEAVRDVEHLGRAGRDAESTLAELEGFAEHAGGGLAGVKASMSILERAATESEATATDVAELAERAGGVVEETVHGIETLRAAVSDAHRCVTALGRRSDDIDQVVDFISEVAGRTNLLSLNASIIAAQAGEHGKAFAVVAEQIRELAAQIARSTKSIADIIHAVREDVEGTASLIDRGDALAVEGVQLARNSLEALGRIQRSTVHGREMAVSIRSAVEAHASSSREVAQLVQSVADASRAVAQAVQLVGRSVAGVNSVSRSVNAMADGVAGALEEQSGLGKRQLESLGRLERMIVDITRAVENHNAATRRVRDTLQHLSRRTGEHEVAVEGLSGVAGQLGARAKALADRVGRFKV